jgi:hypothetical protein
MLVKTIYTEIQLRKTKFKAHSLNTEQYLKLISTAKRIVNSSKVPNQRKYSNKQI